MTLSSRHRIRNSSPGGLRPSTLPLGHGGSWLNDSNVDTYNISGYNYVCNYRKGKRGGGVSLFLRQGIDYQTCDYLTLMNDYVESVFGQLSHKSIKSTRDIIVDVIYRKPNTDVKSFVHEMSNLLSLLQKTNKVVYIMGDYNINLLNVHTHIPTADFIHMMYSYSFFHLITKPTRVTGNTATLIDNIFCNDFPIFSIKFKRHIADTKQYITKRMLTTKNISSFEDRLAKLQIGIILCHVANVNKGIVCFIKSI